MSSVLGTWPRRVLVIGAFLLFHVTQLNAQATSREEEILQQRTDKRARLWPERTSGIVKQVDKFTERGLLEGAQSGKGSNGPQFLLGGMRSGNGMSFGLGYRRVDLWGERLGFRTTVRGTILEAYMFDAEVNFPRVNTRRVDRARLREVRKLAANGLLRSWTRLRQGQPDQLPAGGCQPRLQRALSRLERPLAGRLQAVSTRRTPDPENEAASPRLKRSSLRSQTPGLDGQPDFLRAGFTAQYDYRDLPTGPREGGNYYVNFKRYWDQDLGQHTFNQWDTAVEQYFPYWNKTRVVALRLALVATIAPEGQTVPFYLEPTLGGNENLRGFERYRFHDQSALMGTVEHRWHLFSAGHAAVFFEVGKVAPKATQLNLARAKYTGGIGFRFTLRDAVVMRIDNAVSNEGYRFMWTFSNPW